MFWCVMLTYISMCMDDQANDNICCDLTKHSAAVYKSSFYGVKFSLFTYLWCMYTQ